MTVDAWLFRTDSTQNESRVEGLLSADERAHANGFRFQRDRTRYVNAHGVMREILGSYIGVHAASLLITRGENGKPCLDDRYRADIQFNLSHSGQYGIVVVSIRRPVGVDVEALRADFTWPELADRYFSWRESAWLRTLPPDEALRWFFRLWVAKEAVLKASGVGLSEALREVEPPRGEPGSTAARGGLFWVSELAVSDGYVAALAVNGADAPALRQVRLDAPASYDQ
jgi:4'-phosphopantetheinyl transferase